MRALLISLNGVEEVAIGPAVEKTQALLENRPPVKERLSNLESMYRLIGCDTVTGAGYPDAYHACWADENALLTLAEGDQVNIVSWYPEKLIGKLLITGFEPSTGKTIPATLTAEELQSMVKIGELRSLNSSD